MTATYEHYSQTATDPRTYGGTEWSRFFRAMFSTGVEYGKPNGLVVSAQTPNAMAVNVATGSAWVYGYYMTSADISANTIEAADASWNRIDRIILRNTFATGITIEVLKGTAAASPAAPALTTAGGTIYEYALAQVLVTAGVTEISGNATTLITDERTYSTMQYIAQSSLIWCGDLNMGSKKITNIADATRYDHIISKTQADASDNEYSIPVGAVLDYGSTVLPANVKLCDGTAISRTTYAALYALISTTYGVGDGSTTFNLPNYTGRVVVGLKSTDTDFDTIGETGGEATVTLLTEHLPPHTHSGVKYFYEVSGLWETKNTNASGANTSTTGSTGGGGAHQNMQPTITQAFGIRVI